MKFKAKKEDNKTMVATWSDSDSTEYDGVAEEIANVCLMAKTKPSRR